MECTKIWWNLMKCKVHRINFVQCSEITNLTFIVPTWTCNSNSFATCSHWRPFLWPASMTCQTQKKVFGSSVGIIMLARSIRIVVQRHAWVSKWSLNSIKTRLLENEDVQFAKSITETFHQSSKDWKVPLFSSNVSKLF